MDLDQKVEELKKSGFRIFKAKIAGVNTVYRSINRKEFRDMQKAIAEKTDLLQKGAGPDASQEKRQMIANNMKEEGEEMLVLKAVVSPKMDTVLDLQALPAGFVMSVAEKIMVASGFSEDIEPEEL